MPILYGVNVLRDDRASIDLAMATAAHYAREICAGFYVVA